MATGLWGVRFHCLSHNSFVWMFPPDLTQSAMRTSEPCRHLQVNFGTNDTIYLCYLPSHYIPSHLLVWHHSQWGRRRWMVPRESRVNNEVTRARVRVGREDDSRCPSTKFSWGIVSLKLKWCLKLATLAQNPQSQMNWHLSKCYSRISAFWWT